MEDTNSWIESIGSTSDPNFLFLHPITLHRCKRIIKSFNTNLFCGGLLLLKGIQCIVWTDHHLPFATRPVLSLEYFFFACHLRVCISDACTTCLMLGYRPLDRWLLLVSTAMFVSANDPQIANLGYAQYQGSFNPSTNVTSFIGIRFTAPPVGK